jgi:hypothetical protein
MASATRAFATSVLPSLLAIAEGIKRLPDELRPMVRDLARRGWFISGSMDMSHLRTFQALAEDSKPEDIDYLMSQWVREQTPDILNRCIARFPARAHILRAAALAHHEGKYELSVPILLIQVEGMCVEVLGRKLFSTKAGVPQTKSATEALVDDALSEVIFLPLREANGLTASEATRGNWPDSPNRHEILHGQSVDYATELNSLKALSLLDYFATFIASDDRTTHAGSAAA